MDVKQVQYIETNFYKTDEAKRARISENSSQNQAVICENHKYYWKQNNANSIHVTKRMRLSATRSCNAC